MVHPGGLLALRLALRAVAKATLSFLVPAVNTTISSIPSLLKVTENMVHPGGFEPPTARFVAEYSIQLSYGCRINKTNNKWRWERDSNPRWSFWPHTPLAGERLQPTRPSHHIRCVGGIIRFFENMSNHFLKKPFWLLDLSTFCINKVRLKNK